VENSVDNLYKKWYFSTRCFGSGYIFGFILAQYAHFPLIFAEKRYKLINFAPK